MKKISRRAFLKTSASAATVAIATPLLTKGWYSLEGAEAAGYFERKFGLSDRIYQKVLTEALSKGGDFADLFFEHTIINVIGLEDGNVNQARSQALLGVGIRTVKDDQTGYGFTEELSEKSMLAAASTAASIANAGARKATHKYESLKIKNYYPLNKLYTSIPLDSKLSLARSLNEKCFARSASVIKVSVNYLEMQKRVTVVTSDGTKVEDLRPKSYLAASVVAEKNGKRENADWDAGGRRDYSFYTPSVIDELARTVVDLAVVRFNAIQPTAGEMPVVLGPGLNGILLHESVGHGLEADFNRKGISTYSTMMGKKVAEPFVTVIDDGTVPNLVGSINVDDEGTPGQKTILIDKGILTSYMHDKISSRHYKVKPTGNGRREAFIEPPQPRMTNTYMLPGSASPEDVIKSVKKGIYVKLVGGGEVKIGEGDFTFHVTLGQIIEDGKLTSPIKDLSIVGNGPKMLQNIVMVANDFRMHYGGRGSCGKGSRVPVGFGLPTVLVKSMTVSGVKRKE